MNKGLFSWRLPATVAIVTLSNASISVAETPPWTGEGNYRMIVTVAPEVNGGRKSDEVPAAIQIDASELLKSDSKASCIDTASIQVVGCDPKTLQPLATGNFAYGRTQGEFAFRWYDDSIPWNFPDFDGAMDRTDGKILRKNKPGFGHLTSAADDGFSGKLTWLHRQVQQETATYCIYFNTRKSEALPAQLPARGWVGDGGIRFDRTSASTTGCTFTRIALTDWNGDGLTDIVFGEYAGQLYWFPNLGTAEKPEYRYFKMIFDEEGNPVDVGQYATPAIADWDGDGREDVLIGCENNRLIWYRNAGNSGKRKLRYMGFVTADGKPLENPITPLTWGSPEIFTREDSPVPEIVDWDGDGQLDLLAGGWITGRIFFYKNMGRDAAGIPQLHLVGPLECDGKPLNVQQWAASPCVADFDGDGDLDLLSGSDFRLRKNEAPPGAHASTLRYYENIGTRTRPSLTERPFPREGGDPFDMDLARACAADLFHRGKLDLVVGRRQEIFIWPNVGDRNHPQWQASPQPIRLTWGTASLPAGAFIDYDHDRRVDLQDGFSIWRNSKEGNPYQFKEQINLLAPGGKISHRSNIGDNWTWARIHDFNRDGRCDILFGDWFGRVWHHRNLGKQNDQIDLTGETFKLTDDSELRVGPMNKDVNKDFAALQGARTTFVAADFDGDARTDLVVGDTYGIVRYYHNEGTVEAPVFSLPLEIGNLHTRIHLDRIDWNEDGRPDVIASAADGVVRVFLNELSSGHMTFSSEIDPGLPQFDVPEISVGDINGDGDEDLLIDCMQGSAFIERSFLRNHGYVPARMLAVEKRGDPG